jgi:hypothetical protein
MNQSATGAYNEVARFPQSLRDVEIRFRRVAAGYLMATGETGLEVASKDSVVLVRKITRVSSWAIANDT